MASPRAGDAPPRCGAGPHSVRVRLPGWWPERMNHGVTTGSDHAGWNDSGSSRDRRRAHARRVGYCVLPRAFGRGLIDPPDSWPLAGVFEQAGGAIHFEPQLSDRSGEIALLVLCADRSVVAGGAPRRPRGSDPAGAPSSRNASVGAGAWFRRGSLTIFHLPRSFPEVRMERWIGEETKPVWVAQISRR